MRGRHDYTADFYAGGELVLRRQFINFDEPFGSLLTSSPPPFAQGKLRVDLSDGRRWKAVIIETKKVTGDLFLTEFVVSAVE
jgi:hypothetical protein